MKSLFRSEDLTSLRALLQGAKSAVLITHVNPDGDAIGSIKAWAIYLRSLGHHVQMMTPTMYPDFLSFLDAEKDILIYKYKQKACVDAVSAADIIFCLDMNTLKRLDDIGDLVEKKKVPKILLDHHPNPDTDAFDLLFSATQVSSSCEICYRLAKELNLHETLPSAMAEPLYVGLMTDTNNFSNSVNASTFYVAAELMELGVNKDWVQQQVFGMFSESRMRLLAHAVLNKMVVLSEHKAAYIILTLAELNQYDFQSGDTEGFVNIPLNIRGVDFSGFFVETPEFIRVSLRSRGDINVNEMAKAYFNGGGHQQASGGRLYCAPEAIPQILSKVLAEYIPATKEAQ